MTVISTIITHRFTAHASDSLITPFEEDDMDVNWKKKREWRKPKIIPVKHLRGAMSYWGLATTDKGWNTLAWLREQARKAGNFKTAELFAQELRNELTREFKRMPFNNLVTQDWEFTLRFMSKSETTGFQSCSKYQIGLITITRTSSLMVFGWSA